MREGLIRWTFCGGLRKIVSGVAGRISWHSRSAGRAGGDPAVMCLAAAESERQLQMEQKWSRFPPGDRLELGAGEQSPCLPAADGAEPLLQLCLEPAAAWVGAWKQKRRCVERESSSVRPYRRGLHISLHNMAVKMENGREDSCLTKRGKVRPEELGNGLRKWWTD